MRRLILFLFILIVCFYVSCEEEDEIKDKSNKIEIKDISAENVSYKTALVKARIPETFGSQIEQYGHCWSTEPNPDLSDSISVFTNYSTSIFISSLNSLNHNTTYYVRAYLKFGSVISYGAEITFKTLEIKVPTLITKAYSNLRARTIESGGNVTKTNGGEIISRGVCWNKAGSPTLSDSVTIDSLGLGSYTSKLKNLDVNTIYYIRAYASNEVGTAYGNEISFTTMNGTPVFETLLTDITMYNAQGGGNITNDGGLSIIEKGVCWNVMGSPTINDQKTMEGFGIESFKSNVNELNLNSSYNIRAYITNEIGTYYANEISFITRDGSPIINTLRTYNVTTSSAFCDGELVSNEYSPVTEKGICWNTIGEPSTIDNISTVGPELGTFASELTGLEFGSTYYIRAYATNSIGTAYGNELVLNMDWGTIQIQDYDGNWYNTVKIGEQVWLKENLKTTHYPDGIEIVNGQGVNTYYLEAPEYYFNYNNSEQFVDTYGRLYTWYAAKKACPDGWHMPTQEDWVSLISYIGNDNGAKLKSKGTIQNATGLWESPNVGGTDDYGLSILPSGYRANSDVYIYMGFDAMYTYSDDYISGPIFMYNSTGFGYTGNGSQGKYGNPVRCIKD